MKKNKFISTVLLWPLSRIYGAVVAVRNYLFDWHILKQQEFDVPIIVVGNIAIGGTGKTPHTEYIIEAMRYSYRIGVLSRGYKRKTKGFVLASRSSTPSDIGDEPFQIYRKYTPDIKVAVCENRCEGIQRLLEIDHNINLIVLDDAFQHRYVKPTASIVLTEFKRPVYNDALLPLGRLRESPRALNRADIIVVTKCPDEVKPMDLRIITKNLNLFPYQKLFFSKYVYGNLVPVFPDETNYIPYIDWLTASDSILVISGVANPRPFVRFLKRYKSKVRVMHFPDHHNFTRKDIMMIHEKFEALSGEQKYIITTEKDSVRLACNPYYPHLLKSRTFYLPIKVEFMTQSNFTFEEELRHLILPNKN